MKYDKHIFICTNQRPEGEKRSCGEACGMELVKMFKKSLKEKGLSGTMRAQRAGCLDACDHGPSLVVYPEGVFYGNVQPADVEEIVQEHLVHDRPVSRLMIDFSKPTIVPDE
jgi:(2Fe-2S) ferredoxin